MHVEVNAVWVDVNGKLFVRGEGWVLAPWPEGFEFLEPLRR